MPKPHQMDSREFASLTTANPATGNTIHVNVKRDLRIADVDAELAHQSSLYAWYGELLSEAEKGLDDARYEEHCAQEDLDAMLRREARKKGDEPKETDIRMRVKRHPKMRRAYEKRMAAEHTVRRLQRIHKAIEMRGWDLRSLAGNQRQERKAGSSAI